MSKNKVFKTLGASNHTDKERQVDDYYATDEIAIDLLLEQEEFVGGILEPCCGEGHLSKRLIELGYDVHSSDLIDRGYGKVGVDVFSYQSGDFDNVITNPPYKIATPICRHILSNLQEGKKCAMFLKVLFLEGKERKKLFKEFPPYKVYVCSGRITCAKNGDFDGMKKAGGSAVAYAWYVWIGGYSGPTIVDWIN